VFSDAKPDAWTAQWSSSKTREALMEQTLPVGATTGVMRGMRGVVLGLANSRSIAWGIAKATQAAGAELAFTFQGEALEKRVRPLA
jgi:enoyl-[acyl-carrier protein] reductase I